VNQETIAQNRICNFAIDGVRHKSTCSNAWARDSLDYIESQREAKFRAQKLLLFSSVDDSVLKETNKNGVPTIRLWGMFSKTS